MSDKFIGRPLQKHLGECWADPLRFKNLFWPKVCFYDKQIEILKSLVEDDETVVPAGNMLGKDFIAGFAAVWFFCTRRPCRIITSSAKDEHLVVLWGEIKNFITTSTHPYDRSVTGCLLLENGGPLIVNDRDVFWEYNGVRCHKSYIKGMVASNQSIASLGGHHIAGTGDGVPRTMWMNDESSSAQDSYKDMVDPWANRMMIFGNCYPCNNFFKRAVKGDKANNMPGGDIPRAYTEEDVRKWEQLNK